MRPGWRGGTVGDEDEAGMEGWDSRRERGRDEVGKEGWDSLNCGG